MENCEKMKITNSNQFEKLVEVLQKNPTLAKGFHRGNVPNNFKPEWEQLTIDLNGLGPPRRLVDGWQKVWRDLKFKVKKKLRINKIECMATGGGVYKQLKLSPLEENVANLLQFEKLLNPTGCDQGAKQNKQVVEIEGILDEDEMSDNDEMCGMNLPIDEELPGCSSRPTIPTSTPVTSLCSTTKNTKESSAKGKKCNDRQELLQKHSDEQAKILTDISYSLSSTKRMLKKGKKYQKQMLEIEKKKLMLMEERNEREKENHENELKLKRIKLLIKEKELQLLNKNT